MFGERHAHVAHDAERQVRESGRARKREDVVHVDVVLEHAVVPHLVLRLRGLRVPASGLAESGDPPGLQHPAELGDHFRRIGHMVKRVEAHDAIDRFVIEPDAVAVEPEELRSRTPPCR